MSRKERRAADLLAAAAELVRLAARAPDAKLGIKQSRVGLVEQLEDAESAQRRALAYAQGRGTR